MLGDLGDDVIALLAIHFRDALDGQVIRFRRAAGEDDFLRRRVDQPGDLRASDLDGLFRRPAESMVAAGGVAKFLCEVRQHRVDDSRVHRRGRVIVHVNWKLDCHSYSPQFPRDSFKP